MEQKKLRIRVSKEITNILLASEQVLLTAKQSRWKVLFTPDTIIVTNQRVIRYSPSGFLGLHKDIEDYRYEDMANFKISKGPLFGTIMISHRFNSETLILDNLPKNALNSRSGSIENCSESNPSRHE